MKYALGKENRVVNVFDPFVKITDKYLNEVTQLNFDFLDTIETIVPKECQHFHE